MAGSNIVRVQLCLANWLPRATGAKSESKHMKQLVVAIRIYRISSKNLASLIIRHPFTQMGKIVSNFGKGIPIYFGSNCNAFSAACRPVREAYTSPEPAWREIGEFGAASCGESSNRQCTRAPGSRPIAFDVAMCHTLTSSSNSGWKPCAEVHSQTSESCPDPESTQMNRDRTTRSGYRSYT